MVYVTGLVQLVTEHRHLLTTFQAAYLLAEAEAFAIQPVWGGNEWHVLRVMVPLGFAERVDYISYGKALNMPH